ncbi:hypothetical protein [Agaribacter flavus]|uniref:Bacteriocin n=1 Tax=Agaribacter flavus TaxID=1902781 RepID=A0ABV7FLG7_9ALTE
MRDLSVTELEKISGGMNISFGEAVAMGGVGSGIGAAAAGAGAATVGTAAAVGSVAVGVGVAAYHGANALGAESFGKWLGGAIYDFFNS